MKRRHRHIIYNWHKHGVLQHEFDLMAIDINSACVIFKCDLCRINDDGIVETIRDIHIPDKIILAIRYSTAPGVQVSKRILTDLETYATAFEMPSSRDMMGNQTKFKIQATKPLPLPTQADVLASAKDYIDKAFDV